ncbi:hypothetical protein FOL46_002775, partial [Perkinsus olseni]
YFDGILSPHSGDGVICLRFGPRHVCRLDVGLSAVLVFSPWCGRSCSLDCRGNSGESEVVRQLAD